MRGHIFSQRGISMFVASAATLFVIAGSVYLLWPRMQSSWQRHEGSKVNAAQLSQATAQVVPTTPAHMELGTPASLTLPRLHIDLAIKPGTYAPASQTWTIDRTHAFYMQASTAVPAPATPIIYGHDIPAVFMSLTGVAPHELLRITNTDGKALLFQYQGDTIVEPTDDSIRAVSYPDTVLLMTCSGTHFEHRRVLRFSYVGVLS